MDLSLHRFESRLAEYTPSRRTRVLTAKRAAVAAILRFDRGAPDVLLMKRSSHRADRWSGQISFPGGREERSDSSLAATATRETFEEVGVDLDKTARLLGRLRPVRAVARGKLLPMLITPFVFVQTSAVALDLGDEAVEAFWLPLDQAATGELTGKFDYALGPISKTFPCWRYEGHVIWGLTFHMLENLLEVVSSE